MPSLPVTWVASDQSKAHATLSHLVTLCGLDARRMAPAVGIHRCVKCQRLLKAAPGRAAERSKVMA